MENEIELFPVDEFYSYQEYEKLTEYLKWLEKEDVLIAIQKGKLPVIVPSFGEEEKWFRDRNNRVWILIPPDYPFKGFFKKLSDVR